jgi:hypothetical protein
VKKVANNTKQKEKFMKNIKKTFITLSAIFTLFAFSSCYTPSPLYGTWNDNLGNKITFISDGTFVAKIFDKYNQPTSYDGEYTVIDNVIVFSTKTGKIINTEWDIRGSLLYLTWTSEENETFALTLYHTAK